jgi:hypothetical protein
VQVLGNLPRDSVNTLLADVGGLREGWSTESTEEGESEEGGSGVAVSPADSPANKNNTSANTSARAHNATASGNPATVAALMNAGVVALLDAGVAMRSVPIACVVGQVGQVGGQGRPEDDVPALVDPCAVDLKRLCNSECYVAAVDQQNSLVWWESCCGTAEGGVVGVGGTGGETGGSGGDGDTKLHIGFIGQSEGGAGALLGLMGAAARAAGVVREAVREAVTQRFRAFRVIA